MSKQGELGLQGFELFQGDCLEVMKEIPDNCIDLVLTDPPYGITACKWDSVIPFDPMWAQLKRVVKKSGAIVLFGCEPFSSALRMSNTKDYKYDWIWNKSRPSGALNAKRMPMSDYESISVFYSTQCIYNPIMWQGGKNHCTKAHETNSQTTRSVVTPVNVSNSKYPRRVQRFKSIGTAKGNHPTQKPVALMEYLIRTYTHPGETVLDFTMGSGTTGVACVNLNRSFIGIELDEGYFEIAKKRIEEARGSEVAVKPKVTLRALRRVMKNQLSLSLEG